MEKENKQISTIHEKDLYNLFKKLGIKDKFENKNMYCKFCKIIVDKENIYSVLPESNEINVICNKSECVTSLLEYLQENKKIKLEQ